MSEEEITEPVYDDADNSSGGLLGDYSGGSEGGAWMQDFPDELRDDSSLSKFKDVASLGKAYKHMESFRGQSISIPEERDAESMGPIWDKLGRPESPDDYDYQPPDRIDTSEYNFDNQQEFLNQAHDNGLSNDQAKFVLDFYNNMAFDSINDIRNFQAKTVADNTTALQKEWGKGYDENLAMAVRAFDEFATDEDRDFLQGNGLDSNPMLIRMFHKVGTMMTEGSFTGNVGSNRMLSPVVAQTEINAIRSDKSHSLHEAYHSAEHPDHQRAIEEMEKLYGLAYQEEE